MTIRSPSDVNYNTPNINSNSIREGAVALTLGMGMDVNAGYAPIVRSSGDIINYLEGELVATANHNTNHIIATLPVTHPLEHSGFYVATIVRLANPTEAEATVLRSNALDNTLRSREAYVIGDVINLNSITYLGK